MDNLLEYDGLIYSIIGKYPNRYDKEDLYQAAMIGLMDAYRHYKSEFHTKFSTFAYYYIIGEVNKYIRGCSTIKVSKELIELKKRILKTKEVMTQRLGREPTNLELSLFLEVDEEMIDASLLATDEVESLDALYDTFKTYDKTGADILDLKNEIEKLPENEKNLILARYFNDLTQKETSDVLGISQVQVSRNEAKILQKLRTRL